MSRPAARNTPLQNQNAYLKFFIIIILFVCLQLSFLSHDWAERERALTNKQTALSLAKVSATRLFITAVAVRRRIDWIAMKSVVLKPKRLWVWVIYFVQPFCNSFLLIFSFYFCIRARAYVRFCELQQFSLSLHVRCFHCHTASIISIWILCANRSLQSGAR